MELDAVTLWVDVGLLNEVDPLFEGEWTFDFGDAADVDSDDGEGE